jgi:hypothetical protein
VGQYHLVCNIDKKQYLHPHRFGDGLKLMEFGMSGVGTMSALALLLAKDNGRGGGDFHSQSPLIGSWAGDRIVIAGDYGDAWVDPQDLSASVPEPRDPSLYEVAYGDYEELSPKIIAVMMEDEYLASILRNRQGDYTA